MELQTFITETLKSIISGINDTHEFAKANRTIINPISHHYDTFNSSLMKLKSSAEVGKSRVVTTIEFNVAVVATNEEKNNVGGGVKIQVLNLGANTDKIASNQTTSNIKFSIDVALPTQPRD